MHGLKGEGGDRSPKRHGATHQPMASRTKNRPAPRKPPAVSSKKAAPLEVRLAELAKASWTQLRADHPDERFYFYALYTTDDGAYVVPTAWGEKALRSAVKGAHAARSKDGLAELERGLRFSAPDSPYHEVHAEGFSPLPAGSRLLRACSAALKLLDAEGFFGRGRARGQVVVNVVFGDMSDEQWLEHAEALNPKASTDWARESLHIVEPQGDVRSFGGRAYQATAVSLSSDGARLAYSGSGGDVTVLALKKPPKTVLTKRRSGEHWASVLSPDGRTLYLGDRDGIHTLDVATGEKALFAHSGKPLFLAISDDGRRLAASGWDEPVAVYETDTRKRLLRFGKVRPAGLAFSPGGTHLAVAVPTSRLTILDLEATTKAGERPLDPECDETPVAWTRDGNTLAVVSPSDGGIVFLTWPGLEKAGAASVSGAVGALSFAPSGRRLAACVDSDLVVFDRAGREVGRGSGKQEELCACVMTTDEEALAVGRDVNVGPAVLALTL